MVMIVFKRKDVQGWGSGLAVSACLRVSCAVGEGTLGTRVGNEETGSVTQTSNAVARGGDVRK